MKTATTVIIGVMLALVFQGCGMNQGTLSLPEIGRPLDTNARFSLPKVENRPQMTEIGYASWYGPNFHGKKTASGKVFDQMDFTAAHRILPMGSKARVVNLNNDKSVEVTINDRGPFVRGRIIDLSRAAAKALGMLEDGLTRVRIEVFSVP